MRLAVTIETLGIQIVSQKIGYIQYQNRPLQGFSDQDNRDCITILRKASVHFWLQERDKDQKQIVEDVRSKLKRTRAEIEESSTDTSDTRDEVSDRKYVQGNIKICVQLIVAKMTGF